MIDRVRLSALLRFAERQSPDAMNVLKAATDERWEHAAGLLRSSEWGRTRENRLLANELARALETGEQQTGDAQ